MRYKPAAAREQKTATPERTVASPEAAPEGALFQEVAELLHKGEPKKALERLGRVRHTTARVVNARAVCQMRLGRASDAVALLRPLVMSDSMLLRPDVPAAWKVNFATALLLDNNVAGSLHTLDEIGDVPEARELRQAVAAWKRGLSFWQKLRWYCGDHPARAVQLDFQPGTV